MFEQVRGVGMTQGVTGHALADTALPFGGADGAVKDVPADGLLPRPIREEPGLRRTTISPILSQTLAGSAGQGDLPIFVALALPNPEHHPFAVDVVGPQSRGLRYP